MANEVLDFLAVMLRHNPAPPTLKNDRFNLHLAFLAPGAEHRELLRLDEIFYDLPPARALVAAGGLAHAFGPASVKLHLAGFAQRVSGPIIRRGIAIGMKNLGLEVAYKCLDLGAGVWTTKGGKVARKILGQIDGAGAGRAGGALEKGVVGIGEKL